MAKEERLELRIKIRFRVSHTNGIIIEKQELSSRSIRELEQADSIKFQQNKIISGDYLHFS